MYGLKQQEIDSIINIFASFPEVEYAVLYGSRAKGNFKEGSDIDLVLKGKKLNTTILNKISWEIDDLLLPYTFDLSIFQHITNSELIEHIERVGIIFYAYPQSPLINLH
jgi:predicted nucleotidyltransferase